MDRREQETLAQQIASGEGQKLIVYPAPDFEVSVIQMDDKVVLYWNDYIANYWVETYDKVSQAIARIALMNALAESERDDTYFANDNETFARNFDEFVYQETSVAS